ncbi:MAG: Uma2 family endonuclease [Acidobacteriota bacterium]|nr:Uma2 family endonuclease [Acidobacteriota bacterium]
MKATLVSVEEYLHSSYEVDCDYVDGELVEREVGERDHSELQGYIHAYYLARKRKWGVYPFVEQRIRISERRYRVPDICITVGRPREQIFTVAPLAVFEVLSPRDRVNRVQARIDDFLSIGVRYVWVIDPRKQRVHAHDTQGSYEVTDGILRTADPDTELPLRQIFEEIAAD